MMDKSEAMTDRTKTKTERRRARIVNEADALLFAVDVLSQGLVERGLMQAKDAPSDSPGVSPDTLIEVARSLWFKASAVQYQWDEVKGTSR